MFLKSNLRVIHITQFLTDVLNTVYEGQAVILTYCFHMGLITVML